MNFVYSDGGRVDSGYRGKTGDCGVRALAIVTGRSYREIWEAVCEMGAKERIGKRKKSRSHPASGIYRPTMDKLCTRYGGIWNPTMTIGSGCRVHLNHFELPVGRLIARVSKHYVALIDGVIFDTHNPMRDGSRCVYGYWIFS